jgi:hypothetical protein
MNDRESVCFALFFRPVNWRLLGDILRASPAEHDTISEDDAQIKVSRGLQQISEQSI